MGIRQLDFDASITVEDEDGAEIRHKARPGAEHVMTYGTMLEGTYYVRVEATEAGENEYRLAHQTRDPSPNKVEELRAAERAADLPDKPTGLGGRAVEDLVTLTWDDPQDDGITGYQVLRRDNSSDTGDFAVLEDDTGTAATTYEDASVEPGGRYTYRVRARNAAGLGGESDDFHAFTYPLKSRRRRRSRRSH